MILSRCNFYSKILQNHVDVNVLLPSMSDNDHFFHGLDEIYRERKPAVLYLLHGALDDYTMWLRHTNIERYAEKAGIAVVMPSGQNGFYCNAMYGLRYYDYITEELPRFVEYTFPVAKERSARFVAGASMGGYGAARCALGRPDLYAAFGNFSGAVDPGKLAPLMEEMGFGFFRYDLIFGGSGRVAGSRDDLKVLAASCAELAEKPYAFVACGEGDTNNYGMNRELYETLKDCGFQAEFMGGEGEHDWDFWDHCARMFVEKIENP